MSKTLEIKIPDIGDFQEVTVIEVLVKPGDRVQVEDSLITLESDKATMDVPSPSAGTVTEVKVKVGDKVAEGALVLTLEPSTDVTPMAKSAAATSAKATPAAVAKPASAPKVPTPVPVVTGDVQDAQVPRAQDAQERPRWISSASCWCLAPVPVIRRRFAPLISI